MPVDRRRYPANWNEISLRIRERDGWQCKFCGAANGQPHPITGSIVVLTVAHIHDPNPSNCEDDNLAALCQRCHNILDMPMRQEHARQTRTRRRIEAAQLAGQMMFGNEDEVQA